MVTGDIDIKEITMLTDTFGYTEIQGMDAVFLTASEIVVDVEFHVFLLLGGRLDLKVIVVRRGHDFLQILQCMFLLQACPLINFLAIHF
jgi:hypothetical protein